LPENYSGNISYSGEVRVHPNGNYLYATNRGMDTVVVFFIQENGKIFPRQWISSFGSYPRGMNITKSGKWLFVANQNGNNVVWYRVGDEDGLLKYENQVKNVTTAIDVEFSV